MEPISIVLSTAVGYIIKAASESKTVGTAKEELLEGFWNWIRPFFIEDVPEIKEKPDDPETENKVSEHLLQIIKDEDYFNKLAIYISKLKEAGIKEKNIVRRDIERVKKIKIGDKEYLSNETYNRKNIIEGSVKDADEFILGDGY